jgi:hypothetical protein
VGFLSFRFNLLQTLKPFYHYFNVQSLDDCHINSSISLTFEEYWQHHSCWHVTPQILHGKSIMRNLCRRQLAHSAPASSSFSFALLEFSLAHPTAQRERERKSERGKEREKEKRERERGTERETERGGGGHGERERGVEEEREKGPGPSISYCSFPPFSSSLTLPTSKTDESFG